MTSREAADQQIAFAIVLAAGEGRRFKGGTAKPLQPLARAPMLEHILDMLGGLCRGSGLRIVVVRAGLSAPAGARIDEFIREYSKSRGTGKSLTRICVAEQAVAGGTGAAVKAALPQLAGLPEAAAGLVVNADTPLIPAELAVMLLDKLSSRPVILGFRPEAAGHSYGKLCLEGDRVTAIVEADEPEYENAGSGLASAGLWAASLAMLRRGLDGRDAQTELRLTEALLNASPADWVAAPAADAPYLAGANTPAELVRLETLFQERARQRALEAGVIMPAPQTVFFAYDTEVAPDVVIEPFVVFGRGVVLQSQSRVRSFCYLAGLCCQEGAEVGPFTRVRGDSLLARAAKLGSFVDAKAVVVGRGSKIAHLCYVGDSLIGADVNIGAGVVTANYDGQSKHRTTISDGAFIGSQATLIAPVSVGRDALVAAAAAVRKPVSDAHLYYSKNPARQVSRRRNRLFSRKCGD